MKKLKASEIRQKYLDFFVEKGHMVEPSAPLVPIDDDTLLWINSGVATLKKYFDGRETPKKPRIVNSQKAIRTNDIENVGFTARHHTFFEMLGNFSIGDYFKQEAIEFAWEFLTSDKWMGMEPDKLYVTIHPEDMEHITFGIKILGLKKVVLFALKVTSGILVKGLQDRTLRFSMIAEKHMDKTIRQKKCIQVEKMNAILKYGT